MSDTSSDVVGLPGGTGTAYQPSNAVLVQPGGQSAPRAVHNPAADPRLQPSDGGTPVVPPAPGVAVTAVTPNTGPAKKVTSVVLTGTGLANVHRVTIGVSCHNVVVVDDTTVNCDTDGARPPGTLPVVVTMNDTSVVTGPDFTFV